MASRPLEPGRRALPRSSLAAVARSRAMWLLLRTVPYERLRALHTRGPLRALDPLLRRGEVQTLGGVAPRLRLGAADFDYWGGQAYGVLDGSHELEVQEALKRSLRPGDVVVDVGANIGAHALLAAWLVGPEGVVVALDARAECVEAVRRNAARNGFGHVRAIHAAAAAASGETEVIVTEDSLWSRLASVGDHPLEVRRDRVRAVAIDDLVRDAEIPVPRLVKIDVEGAELDVIEGMHELMATARPLIICEMHGKNEPFATAMAQAGYRVVNLDGPEPVERAGGNIQAFCEPWPPFPS